MNVMVFVTTALIAFAGGPASPIETSAIAQSSASKPPATVASAVDREIADIEKELLDAVGAMPESKFDFTPERLQIQDGDYKGVRTFAEQAKHVAASNFAIWSAITGDAVTEKFNDGKGPDAIRSKSDILGFLKESFAFGHKAAATLTPENMLQKGARGESPRLHSAVFAVSHAYDHYGQIVEYLRMNGIVPPASR